MVENAKIYNFIISFTDSEPGVTFAIKDGKEVYIRYWDDEDGTTEYSIYAYNPRRNELQSFFLTDEEELDRDIIEHILNKQGDNQSLYELVEKKLRKIKRIIKADGDMKAWHKKIDEMISRQNAMEYTLMQLISIINQNKTMYIRSNPTKKQIPIAL